jgi:hypothetical protein
LREERLEDQNYSNLIRILLFTRIIGTMVRKKDREIHKADPDGLTMVGSKDFQFTKICNEPRLATASGAKICVSFSMPFVHILSWY